jgi:hypothetical protein
MKNKKLEDCSIEELIDAGKSVMLDVGNQVTDYFGLKIRYDHHHTDLWFVNYSSKDRPKFIEKQNKDLRLALLELMLEAYKKLITFY